MQKPDLTALHRNDLVRLGKKYGIYGSHRAKSAYLIELLEPLVGNADVSSAGLASPGGPLSPGGPGSPIGSISASPGGRASSPSPSIADNKVAHTRTPTPAPVKKAATSTAKKQSRSTSASSSGSTTFLLICIIVALVASSSYLFMQLETAKTELLSAQAESSHLKELQHKASKDTSQSLELSNAKTANKKLLAELDALKGCCDGACQQQQ